MKDKEKTRKLEKEIKSLEEKKAKRERVNELFQKRNKLKYPALYKVGRGLKKVGGNLSEWAKAKEKQMKEDMENEKKTGKKPKTQKDRDDALYDELFGDSELGVKMGFSDPIR